MTALLLTAAGFAVASVATNDLVELAALMVAFVFSIAVLPILNSLPLSFLRGSAAAAGFALYNTVGLLGAFAGHTFWARSRKARGHTLPGCWRSRWG